MGQFFSQKKDQTGGVGSEGDLAKGDNFLDFFPGTLPLQPGACIEYSISLDYTELGRALQKCRMQREDSLSQQTVNCNS